MMRMRWGGVFTAWRAKAGGGFAKGTAAEVGGWSVAYIQPAAFLSPGPPQHKGPPMIRFLAHRAFRTVPLVIAFSLTPGALAQGDDAPGAQRGAGQPGAAPSFKGGPVLVLDHVALDKLF